MVQGGRLFYLVPFILEPQIYRHCYVMAAKSILSIVLNKGENSQENSRKFQSRFLYFSGHFFIIQEIQ
jgi:hypothetical protein